MPATKNPALSRFEKSRQSFSALNIRNGSRIAITRETEGTEAFSFFAPGPQLSRTSNIHSPPAFYFLSGSPLSPGRFISLLVTPVSGFLGEFSSPPSKRGTKCSRLEYLHAPVSSLSVHTRATADTILTFTTSAFPTASARRTLPQPRFSLASASLQDRVRIAPTSFQFSAALTEPQSYSPSERLCADPRDHRSSLYRLP